MTFDEDERSDPRKTWLSKLPIEELASENYTVTTESVIQKTSARYDPNSENIVNEIAMGVCSCGAPIDAKNFAMCYYGDLVCGMCKRVQYNGRCICRTHSEYYLGSKEETIVLISIIIGLNIGEIKKLSGLSEVSIRKARNMLENRKYLKVKSTGLFFNSKKPTEAGIQIVKTLVEVYKQDADFGDFLKRIGVDRDVETEPRQK